MPVYVIADIKVTDDRWVPAYAASVHDLVHKHGGKYLSRSGNVKTLEGSPQDTTVIALLEFPSDEAVEAFATDPQYALHAVARQDGSRSRVQLIDDTDLAGTIPYLPPRAEVSRATGEQAIVVDEPLWAEVQRILNSPLKKAPSNAAAG
jgi:uncharacterized protein (DUF1330 family)